MKALVVMQPFAALIMAGIKQWETRPWPPNGPMRPDGVKGLPGLPIEPGERIVIVAGRRKLDPDKIGWEPWEPLMDPDRPGLLRRPLAFGAALGTVEVVEALPMIATLERHPFLGDVSCDMPVPSIALDDWEVYHGDPFAGGGEPLGPERMFGDWTPGRWAWRLADPDPFTTPIPTTGRQGVYRYEDGVL